MNALNVSSAYYEKSVFYFIIVLEYILLLKYQYNFELLAKE